MVKMLNNIPGHGNCAPNQEFTNGEFHIMSAHPDRNNQYKVFHTLSWKEFFELIESEKIPTKITAEKIYDCLELALDLDSAYMVENAPDEIQDQDSCLWSFRSGDFEIQHHFVEDNSPSQYWKI